MLHIHIFILSDTGLKGREYKLKKPRVNFFVRVIDLWNSLPEYVLQCNTINTFKRRINCVDY